MINKEDFLLFKSIIDITENEELDPLNDDVFINNELLYVTGMADEIVNSIDNIYDKTKSIVQGMRTSYNREGLFKEVYSYLQEELGINLPKSIRPLTAEIVNSIYEKGKETVLVASMNLKDFEAIEYLKSSDNFYVGKQFGTYNEQVRDVLRNTIFADGVGAKQVAKEIQKNVGDFLNLKFHQYENVARTSANRARNWSRVFAYEEKGIKELEVFAVLDERTSEICRNLDGTVYKIEDAVGHLNKIMSFGEDKLPEVSPFASLTDKYDEDNNLIQEGILIDNNKENPQVKTASELVKIGVVAPPYHGRCRTVLVEREV